MMLVWNKFCITKLHCFLKSTFPNGIANAVDRNADSPVLPRKRSSLDALELWRMSHMKKKKRSGGGSVGGTGTTAGGRPSMLKKPNKLMDFTPQDIEEFQEIFQFFDVNGTKTMHMKYVISCCDQACTSLPQFSYL